MKSFVSGLADSAKEQATDISEKVSQKTSALESKLRGNLGALRQHVDDNTSQLLKGGKERVAESVSDVSERISGKAASIAASAGEGIDSIYKTIDDNTPQVIKDTKNRVVESVDVLTGNKILQTVLDMVELQERYNDVLASKLEEALTRISILETSLGKGNAL